MIMSALIEIPSIYTHARATTQSNWLAI